jgi:hypothetical protein
MTKSDITAREAARLLRTTAAAKPRPEAVATAQSAARLLGVADKAASMSAFERQRNAMATQDQHGGLMTKLRKIFGAKS